MNSAMEPNLKKKKVLKKVFTSPVNSIQDPHKNTNLLVPQTQMLSKPTQNETISILEGWQANGKIHFSGGSKF